MGGSKRIEFLYIIKLSAQNKTVNIYNMFQISLRVATMQKPTVDTKKTKGIKAHH